MFKPGPSWVRERLGWTKNHWVVGYVGRLAYVKGIDLLADAFRKIRKTIPHARLIIVGSGEEERETPYRLERRAHGGIVHIESDVPHELLAEWYRAMDLFVMPSRYENCSNAVLEALACGVPFLVSDVGGNRRLVETEGGWLFRPGFCRFIGAGSPLHSREPVPGQGSGSVGGEKVRHRYSWETSAKRLEDILQSCLDMKVGTACRP